MTIKDIKLVLTIDKLPFVIILALGFLLPVFFIPSSLVTLQFSKSFLIFIGIVAALSIYIIKVLKDGKFELPMHPIFAAGLALIVVFLMSALSGSSPRMSISGYGFELGTFSFILVMFILLFLCTSLFRSQKKIFYSYLLFSIGSLVVALFHILRLFFGANFLSFGFFPNIVSNTIGTWNDLGFFLGAGIVVSLVTIEMFKTKKWFKWLFYASFILSLFILVLVNYSLIWTILASFALLFFVYVISFDGILLNKKIEVISADESDYSRGSSSRRFSYLALILLFVSIFFLSPIGKLVSNSATNYFNVSSVEVRPSWVSTFEITKSVLKNDPILGTGPNRFSQAWHLFKPEGINASDYWNADFNATIGLTPTFLVTVGILGFLLWLAFLGLFVYSGIKTVFTRNDDSFSRYLTLSSFAVSLYLWVITIVYTPSVSLFALAFFFSGLFLASAFQSGTFQVQVISFFRFPRVSFLFVMGLVLVFIASVSFGYIMIEKTVSSVYFQKGNIAWANGDLPQAETNILRAINLEPNDIYYRALTEIYLLRLNSIIANSIGKQEVLPAVREEFQLILGHAIDAANNAIIRDRANFENWLAYARVYETIMPLGIDQAYENSKATYAEALSRNPKNPTIHLMEARLEIAKGNLAEAKELVGRAIELKDNYAEAIYLLSQIQVTEGNIRAAISSTEKIALISPNNAGVYFGLGLLKYNNKDFPGAIAALEYAVRLVPDYANAKYFLGLSLDKTGKRTQAIKEFEDIETLNPDNAEVKLILKNLKAGADPFANATPPIDNKPESRSTLPVEER